MNTKFVILAILVLSSQILASRSKAKAHKAAGHIKESLKALAETDSSVRVKAKAYNQEMAEVEEKNIFRGNTELNSMGGSSSGHWSGRWSH